MVEKEILESIKRRPGISATDDLLSDMIKDCISDVRDAINYKDGEALPAALCGVVKELVLEKINKDGAQGISAESQSSGGSTTYTDDIPKAIKRKIYKYRRFRR